MVSEAIDLFIEDARLVTVAEAAGRVNAEAGLKRIGTGELAGPCPVAGGTDGFSLNGAKGVWNCRKCGDGGRDGIGLAAHVLGLDVTRREDFLSACAAALGRDVPDGAEAISAERRAELDAQRAAARAKSDEAADQRESEAATYRDKERAKARGRWEHASSADAAAGAYLDGRLGLALPGLPFARTTLTESYWLPPAGTGVADRRVCCGDPRREAWVPVDEGRGPASVWSGPAMVLPFVGPDGAVIGCHLTYLSPGAPKGRPLLTLRQTVEGRPVEERLPTKKMRGTKKGGLIPLLGFVDAGGAIVPETGRTRLVCGEGIENTLAVGAAEGFRADTLYAAAGDLGNLAGKADTKCGFGHPTDLKAGKDGKRRAVRVPGPVPAPDADPAEAMVLPDGVREVLLVGDGDSEPYFTMAAMMRAEARLAAILMARDLAPAISTVWPERPGVDFVDLLMMAAEAA